MKYKNGEKVDIGDVVSYPAKARVVATGYDEGDTAAAKGKERMILTLLPIGDASTVVVYADQVDHIDDVKPIDPVRQADKVPFTSLVQTPRPGPDGLVPVGTPLVKMVRPEDAGKPVTPAPEAEGGRLAPPAVSVGKLVSDPHIAPTTPVKK